MRIIIFLIVICALNLTSACTPGKTYGDTESNDLSSAQIKTGALLETDSTGKSAEKVKKGVVRIICRPTSVGGTGFLHKSGVIITAAHVVSVCATGDLSIITASGKMIGVSSVSADDVKDLAILRPNPSLIGIPLTIAQMTEPKLGSQVATWGYPGGYNGLFPLLSVGYFSGVQDFKAANGRRFRRWVINAAFNGGNSGGPVLSVENGQVIGVVSSKLAPLPPNIAKIIEGLKNDRSGMSTGWKRNGKPLSQAQLAGIVLDYLRTQVQLVIGYAVTTKDLNDFLESQGITP